MSNFMSLAGLQAASAQLATTSDNVANSGTVGFKKSRAQFADIFAEAPLPTTSKVFNQGSIEVSDNALDMAISGEGFFTLKPSMAALGNVYTRAGSFSVNNERYVVDSFGQYLQTYPVNSDGSIIATGIASAQSLRLPESSGLPRASGNITMGFNLPTDASVITAAFDRNDPSTFNHMTETNVYDSLGYAHTASIYFSRETMADAGAVATSDWSAHVFVGDEQLVANGYNNSLKFDTSGALLSPLADVGYAAFNPQNGADQINLAINFGQYSTQKASPFSVLSLSQDGYPSGRMDGMDIDSNGVVRASYSNGTQVALGQVILADFNDPSGLQAIGNTNFAATVDSGDPDFGRPGIEGFGSIRGGALESSNVDITQELVELIAAQRNFQANAKVFETSSGLTQTILGILS